MALKIFLDLLPLALKEGYGEIVQSTKRKNMTKFAMMLMLGAFSVHATETPAEKTTEEQSSEEAEEDKKEEESTSEAK